MPSPTRTKTEHPWQLDMFQRSLKKPLKLQALMQLAGEFENKECILITCGDNNGALNWYFRAAGGHWTWADIEDGNLEQIAHLLGESVIHLTPYQFNLPTNRFDVIVCIDVLEHLPEDQTFLKELFRILKPEGKALVTVPNGDQRLLANRIKGWVGMTPEVYGHTRAGYTIQELELALSQAGYDIHGTGGYSRFFTEMIELAINFMYVKVLPRRGNEQPAAGQIAPSSAGELKTHSLAYRVYSLIFPILKVISRLDTLLPTSTNNAVIAVGVKQRG